MTEIRITPKSAPLERGAHDAQSSWNGIRSLAVTVGPSLVLDALVAVGTAVAAADIVRPRFEKHRVPQLVAPLIAAAAAGYMLKVRPWVLHWGATDAEVNASLPGDELILDPAWQSTRAIHIAAPAEAVWPWLAQMGQDRGGLYSYDWLENLAGLDFHSADRIVPEWQHVQVGEIVRFAPNQDTLVVSRVEPNECLVWRVLNPATHQAADSSSGPIWVDATWSFVLLRVDEQHSRLIQRFRFGIRPRLLGVLYTALIEIPHFVMERRMLLGIRERAERQPAVDPQ